MTEVNFALKDCEARVFITFLSLGQVDAQFALCFASMASTLNVVPEGCPRFDVVLSYHRDANISYGRERVAMNALKLDSTHLLFVDSDQTFPQWTVQKLLSWKKPIVAANIVTKRLKGSTPTARAFEEGNSAGRMVYTTMESSGLEEVWRVGTGIMLIETDIFRAMPQPWFPTKWLPEKQAYRGEDWCFCEQAEEMGIPIYIDHDLSKEVGHIGPVEFTHGFTVETRRKALEQDG